MWSSLQKNFSFILVIFIGITTIASFFVFYTKQKNFSEAQKEFLLALDTLETDTQELGFAILQNYIYAYNNNDLISKELREIENDFKELVRTNILVTNRYTVLQPKLGYLKNEIDQTFRDVERYLMYNAAVKNSLLFLSGEEQNNAAELPLDLLRQSTRILQSLFFARRISDIAYLQHVSLLKSDPDYPKKLQRYIRLFNLHTTYILNNMPLLLRYKKKIEESKIKSNITSIKSTFAKLSVQDSTLLNKFSVTLLLIFITIFLYLIFTLVRYKKEHNSLVRTTYSLRHSLTHDILTGLKNRIAFDKEKQNLSHPLVILANVDRFKDINDVFGSEIGDALLQQLFGLIKNIALHQEGYVESYRIGGDEVCLLFENISTHAALLVAQEIERVVAHTNFQIQDNELNVSVTISINCNSPLLENADLALKSIKRQRTQKVIVYDDSLKLHEQAKKNIETVKMVKKALEEDRLLPYFQPIVNLNSGKVEKFEALVRIEETQQILSPFFFLDIVRRTHLYFEITQRMLEKTFQIATQYPQHRFSINLSISDIDNDELIESLFAFYQKHLLVANRVDIELLETEELYNIPKVQQFIDRVHSFGSLVLIDDFGSGYSNFAYFADFEIDIIKIDGSIIKEITTNQRKLHMLKSIVMFAKSMNLKIVAEFVDDPNIVPVLKELEIDYAQGYLYSAPTPEPLTDLNKSKS